MGVNTDLICSFSEILMALGGAPLHLQWRARIGYGGFDPQKVELPNRRLPNFGNSCVMTPGLSTGAVVITDTLVTDAESSAAPFPTLRCMVSTARHASTSPWRNASNSPWSEQRH